MTAVEKALHEARNATRNLIETIDAPPADTDKGQTKEGRVARQNANKAWAALDQLGRIEL